MIGKDLSRRTVIGAAIAIGACAPAAAGPSLGGVRRISPRLDTLISADAVVEELGSGYLWAEGPAWVRDGNYLLFTDVPGNVMYKWSEGAPVEEFLRPSGFAGEDAAHLREAGANGLEVEAAGTLLMADCGNRRLSRLDLTTKQKTSVVDNYQGKTFNSPNDIVTHASGAIYFTDPPYGLEGMQESPLREIPFHGVYRLDPSGALAVVDDSLAFPNGVAFSPDQSTLYVACSDDEKPQIVAYTLGADGLPTNSRLFFDAKPHEGPGAPGKPDGLTVDQHGNLFATGPGGVLVIAPDGELLGVIGAGRPIANCKFGEDGATLFVTAHDKLGRIRTTTRAANWG